MKFHNCLHTNTRYEKLKQILATKIFFSDTKNENLIELLKLDIEELFEKYEQNMIAKNQNKIKLEETTETLNDMKIKLKLQLEQRELYEKEHSEILKVLKIDTEDKSFFDILPAIKELKKNLEQNETELYSKAQNVLETYSIEDDITIKVDHMCPP